LRSRPPTVSDIYVSELETTGLEYSVVVFVFLLVKNNKTEETYFLGINFIDCDAPVVSIIISFILKQII